VTVCAVELPCCGAGFRNDGKPVAAVSSAISMTASVPVGLRRLRPVVAQAKTAGHPSEDEGDDMPLNSKRVPFTEPWCGRGSVAAAVPKDTERMFCIWRTGANGGRVWFENHELTHDILHPQR
jgi:hypothetical protein